MCFADEGQSYSAIDGEHEKRRAHPCACLWRCAGEGGQNCSPVCVVPTKGR